MSFQLPSQRKAVAGRLGWASAAFIVEALLLLVFLIGSISVFTQLFAAAVEQGAQSQALSQAVAVAGNVSERFANDPESVQPDFQEDGMHVVCAIAHDQRPGGILYQATISVFDPAGGDSLYTVSTSRYVSEVKR